jgi:Siphovirus Gp157
MKPTLYHAAQDVQNKIALCVDEDGVIDTAKLDAIECSFKERAVAVIAVYKGKTHALKTLKSYADEIAAQIKRKETQQERLKDYLQGAMTITGTTSIKSDDGLLQATLYADRDESVEIEEGATFPASLCNDPKPPGPSKTLIRAAILAGEPITGAKLVCKDRLTIK